MPDVVTKLVQRALQIRREVVDAMASADVVNEIPDSFA